VRYRRRIKKIKDYLVVFLKLVMDTQSSTRYLDKFSNLRWALDIKEKGAAVFFAHYHKWEIFDPEKPYGR
jgi:hypothetical protein